MSKRRHFPRILLLLTVLTQFALAADQPGPFRADDLKPGERWFTRDHASGSQDLGHDLTVRRYTGSGKWTCNAAGTDGSKNEHKMAWNKPFYAIENGVVERCWKNAPDNPKPGVKDSRIGPGPNGVPSGGNHLLVRTSDGNLMLYAHARKGSIPDELCPVDDELLSAGQEKGFVFPAGDRPSIRRGQRLGLVGNSGESSGAHLHVHKVAVSNNTPLAIPLPRGMVADFTADSTGDCNGTADINGWSRLNGKPIPQKTVLFWPPTSLGNEYTRIQFNPDDFQRMFEHLSDSGYALDWIDGYSVGGKVYFNHVWKRSSTPWRAYTKLPRADLEKKLQQLKAQGYAPVHLDSYLSAGSPLYAVIFHKGKTGQWRLRTDRTKTQHQAIFNQAKKDGLRPVAISVISVNGSLRYSALYRSESLGSWSASSTVAERDYQAVYDANRKQGRVPVYLNAYMHAGKPYVSAIFASRPPGAHVARHQLSASKFQGEFDGAIRGGYQTDVVTAFDGANSQHRFFGIWRK